MSPVEDIDGIEKERLLQERKIRIVPLMAAGVLALVASRFLLRAHQDLFGLPSDFLAGFFLATGLGALLVGLAMIGVLQGTSRD